MGKVEMWLIYKLGLWLDLINNDYLMIKDKEFIYIKYWVYVLIIIMVVWFLC